MYEALEHWKQYKQKKYPTMNELLEMGYTKPGAMILDEMKEAEELQAIKDAKKKEWDKEMDEFMDGLGEKNGYTLY